MEDNIIIEDVKFDEQLYKLNIATNNFESEYEGGDVDANN